MAIPIDLGCQGTEKDADLVLVKAHCGLAAPCWAMLGRSAAAGTAVGNGWSWLVGIG